MGYTFGTNPFAESRTIRARAEWGITWALTHTANPDSLKRLGVDTYFRFYRGDAATLLLAPNPPRSAKMQLAVNRGRVRVL